MVTSWTELAKPPLLRSLWAIGRVLDSASARASLLLRDQSSPGNGSPQCEIAVDAAMAKACSATANPPLLFQHPAHSLQQKTQQRLGTWTKAFNVPAGTDGSQCLFVRDWGILHGLLSSGGCTKLCLYPKIVFPILFVFWNVFRFLCHCQVFEFPCNGKAKHQKDTLLVNRTRWKSTVRGVESDIHFGKAWFSCLF